ncbi:MAG: pinensin family lanthipeptide [Luteibaculum sp.]
MKKKLKLSQLEVKSFVTNSDAEQIKGGKDYKNTDLSCYRYVSCFEIQCLTRDGGKLCLR